MIIKPLILTIAIHHMTTKIISLIEFARHGARHYRDPNRTIDEVELTEYGYQQNVMYASALKTKYQGLLNGLEPSETRIVSSHRSRCTYSALAQVIELLGHKETYGGNTLAIATPQLKTLISKYDIDVLSKEDNILFKPHLTDCKFLKNLKRKDVIGSEEVAPFYDYLSSHYKRQKFNATAYLKNRTNEIHHFSAIYDLVHSFKSFNMTQTLDDETFNYMRAFKMYIRLQEKYYNSTVSAFYVQNILIEFLTSIDEILSAYTRNKPYKKFILYAGHDSNIVPLLSTFKLTSVDCIRQELSSYSKIEEKEYCKFYPEFLANFLLELHHEGTQYYIVARYNGKVFNLCNNRERCPLFDFRRLIFQTLQKNYTEFCIKGTNSQLERQKGKEKKLNRGMMILAIIVASLIVIRRIRDGRKLKNE